MDGAFQSVDVGYYHDKIDSLRHAFGTTNVVLERDQISVDGKTYPIIDDVIIVIDPDQYPERVRKELEARGNQRIGRRVLNDGNPFAEDIQFTFGAEWK